MAIYEAKTNKEKKLKKHLKLKKTCDEKLIYK